MKSPNFQCHALRISEACLNISLFKGILVFLLLLFTHSLLSQQLAFPTAQGAGAYATGGRGGIVVRVTNLNASGPGSLREALLMTVPRTIVFDVSGRINLTSLLELGIANSNFTVAGQTAPQGGITITGKPVQMGKSGQACNNGIFRYIRFRNGSYTGANDVYDHNGFISDGTDGLILDHCSFSFCDDQAISMNSYSGPLKNITIQRCTFSENATQIIAGHAGSYPRGNITIINNLFVDSSHRTPNMNGDFQWDIINNVFFNFANRLANVNGGSPEINNIGNYYKLGAYSSTVRANVVQGGSPSIYTANNYHTTFYLTPQLDDRILWTDFYIGGQLLPNSYFSSTQHPLLGETPTIKSASQAYTDVLNDVGANKYLNADGSFGAYQDSFDSTKIYNTLNEISIDPFNKSWIQPTLPNNVRPSDYDTDNDGMPNNWEIANGLNPNDANDRNVVQPDGYTNLEYFLNGMSLQTIGITANAGADVSICAGSSTTLTASGGSTYLWSNGATTASITVSPNSTTTYTVTAYDATGANSDTDDVRVTVNPLPTANAGSDVSICQGTSTTLTATGGGSYLWNNGATTPSITVTPNNTTTYSVQVTQNGCSATDNVIVSVNQPPTANAGSDISICQGSSTTLTAIGGGSYIWNNGATTPSITVSPNNTTTYSVEVTQNGCVSTDDVVVTVNPLPTVNAGSDVNINLGQSVTLNATGAATYSWNTSATGSSINVSPTVTTTYTVIGTNGNGCSKSDSVTVNVQTGASVTANAGADVSICSGNSTTLTATGGSTYLWNTGATTASIAVSPSITTNYTVTAYDASGSNSDSDDVMVTVNPLPNANAGADVSTCLGTAVTLTASGGSSYQWITGATTASITVNPNNTTIYSVEVTQNGCSSTDDVTVTVNPQPTINAGDDVTIYVGESVTLTATGGTSYVWSNGAITQSITVNPTITTTYTVTGTSNGCENTDSVTVFLVDDGVAVNAGDDIEICQGESTTLTASGGETYVWSTGATTASITVNPNTTTTYTVTAYSASGNNSDTDEVIVSVTTPPTANAGDDVATCLGTSVTLTASGGPSYLWSTGATTASITVNPNNTTTYSVEATQNGCSDTDDVTVTVNPLPTIDAGNDVTIDLGQSVTLTATGGSTYVWNTGETSSSITLNPTATTTYTVTGTSNGCEGTDTVTVTVIEDSVTANAGVNRTICFGYSVVLTASGGETYLWSTGETTPSITVTPNSTTTYSVTAYNGAAQDSDEVTVFVNPNPVVNISNGSEVTILEGEFVTLAATGANTYLWNNGATQPNIAVSPGVTTIFSVTGYVNNCEDLKEVTVNVVPEVNAFAGDDQTICLNESVTLTASGGDEFLWNTGESTPTIIVSPSEDSIFSVTVYNDLDYDTAEVMVFVNDCSSTEIPENQEYFEFLAYPNPTSGELNVKISGLLNVSNIALYDLSGKMLFQERIANETQQNFVKKLDLSQYSDGIYLLKLVDDTHAVTKKIVIYR